MSLNILSHFDKKVDKGITIWELKSSERAVFLQKLPAPFRERYIPNAKLIARIASFGTNRSSEIEEKIPIKPNIQSGEFAELLLHYALPEKYSKGHLLNPEKWQWKQHKDRALQFSDVILLHQISLSNPSSNDYIIFTESKAGATKPRKDESRLKDAIEGAEEDYLSRYTESLIYLKDRYKDDLNVDAVKWIERFLEAAKFPPYEKHFKAVGIVDAAYVREHIDNVNPISSVIPDNFEVILVSIKDLKEAYESTYKEMLNT